MEHKEREEAEAEVEVEVEVEAVELKEKADLGKEIEAYLRECLAAEAEEKNRRRGRSRGISRLLGLLGLSLCLSLGMACELLQPACSGSECKPPPPQPPPPPLPQPPPSPPPFVFEGEMAPNMLISRGKPTSSSAGQAVASLNDGRYRWDSGTWPGNNQAGWAAIHIGHEEARLPTRVLFAWNSGANFNYLEPLAINYGFPTSYAIWVSPNSTNGSDGDWERRVNESGNRVRTRTHVLEHTAGIAWVRMEVVEGDDTVHLDEIDVYDISPSGNSFDSWFFLGDSNTAFAFERSKAHGSFAENVNAQWPSFFPAIVNGGVGGDKTEHVLARLDSALAEHPAMQFWAVCLGTNNVGGNNPAEVENFRRGLLEIIHRIQADDRVPVVANIPFLGRWDGQRCVPTPGREGLQAYNQTIQQVIAETGALPGPNLYDYFAENCNQLPDEIHPNAEGYQSINRLWAEAAAPIYNAQQP